MAGNPGNINKETIDGVIIRLLKLKVGTEMDYQTYFKIILNRLAIDGIGGKKLPAEESKLLREEFKRIKKLIDKGRFKIRQKKTKVVSPPPSGGSAGGGGGAPPKTGSIVKSEKGKITADKFFFQNYVQPVNVKDITEKVSKRSDPLDRIIERLDSIVQTLTDLNKENKAESERQKKGAENVRRKKREESLESKVFDGIKTAVKKMMAPFQSIWDYILNFLWNVFLGKVVLKLLDWFSDPKNKDKIASIVRFFKDWWPTMLVAYIIFGTSFGKLARTVVKIAAKGAIGFGKIIAKLIAAIAKGKSLKVAGAFAGGRKGLGGSPPKSGGGWKGALLNTGLAVGGTLLTGFAIDKGIDSLMGGDKEDIQSLNPANIDVPDEPKFPTLNAAGGGLADLGKLLGKVGLSSLGPLGLLMSMGMGQVPKMFQGLVSGKKGTDKIPAMLSDGEFVMSKGAVQKYGVDTLESMNAAGGGTNVPKIVQNVQHRAGGGLVSNSPEFWKLAALSAKEDAQNPQGQADVAQSIYNRAATGAYPGGKSISGIIMGRDSSGAWQYQPVRDNFGAFAAIKDQKSAEAAVGKDKLNMAVKSITNPALQQNAKGFVGGRTDFMGESQKKNMKPNEGDITRGKNYNFHGWFYNARLNSPAPTPNVVSKASQQSSQQSLSTAKNNPNSSKNRKKNTSSSSGYGWVPELFKFHAGGEVNPTTIQEKRNSGKETKIMEDQQSPRISTQIPTKKIGRYMRGGIVGENSGINYGSGKDRQYFPPFLAQPGELLSITTARAVQNGAAEQIKNIQATLDPTSNASREGYGNKLKPSNNQIRNSPVKPPSSRPSVTVSSMAIQPPKSSNGGGSGTESMGQVSQVSASISGSSILARTKRQLGISA